MTLSPDILVFALVFGLSVILTRVFIWWADKHAIVDRPNARSSHTHPTPRGGGVAALLATAVGFLMTDGPVLIVAVMSLLGLVSLIDDLRSLPVVPRLLAHAAAVVVALLFADTFVDRFSNLMPAVVVAGFLFLVWLWFINLFNFMDGIDGIAGVETISICVGVAWVLALTDTASSAAPLALILAAATAGFLVWNWSPARVFLGDVGSVPLGFLCAWLLIELAAVGYWAAALILPLYYLADATITIIRRGLRGEKVWRAHKEHFYQRAHQGGLSHAAVSLRVFAANLCLVGLAAATAVGHVVPGFVGAAIVVGFLLFNLAQWGKNAA